LYASFKYISVKEFLVLTLVICCHIRIQQCRVKYDNIHKFMSTVQLISYNVFRNQFQKLVIVNALKWLLNELLKLQHLN